MKGLLLQNIKTLLIEVKVDWSVTVCTCPYPQHLFRFMHELSFHLKLCTRFFYIQYIGIIAYIFLIVGLGLVD